jgi:hypothetical protein
MKPPIASCRSSCGIRSESKATRVFDCARRPDSFESPERRHTDRTASSDGSSEEMLLWIVGEDSGNDESTVSTLVVGTVDVENRAIE